MIYWIFGRPSSGKSTLAKAFAAELAQRGRKVEILDGDDTRRWLTPDCDFSNSGRTTNIRRNLLVANILAKYGIDVICVFVTPLRQMQRYIAGMGVQMIYLTADSDVCRKRDAKGLYRSGTPDIDYFEEPEVLHIKADSSTWSAAKLVESLVITLGIPGGERGSAMSKM